MNDKIWKVQKSEQVHKGIPPAIVAALIALAGVICANLTALIEERMREAQEMKMYKLQNEYEQYISCKSVLVEIAGIEYVRYEITTAPVIAGYHVIVYPYAVLEKAGNIVYLPITGQFTQEEYVADENGNCWLLRENTTKDFLKMTESEADLSIDVKCMVAFQYVRDGKLQKEVYDLRDGNLILSDPNSAVKVLEAWEDDSSMKIDMWEWPCFDQKKWKEYLISMY